MTDLLQKLIIQYESQESIEEDKARVFGRCGGVCGEAPCIEWNVSNQRQLRRQKEKKNPHD